MENAEEYFNECKTTLKKLNEMMSNEKDMKQVSLSQIFEKLIQKPQ